MPRAISVHSTPSSNTPAALPEVKRRTSDGAASDPVVALYARWKAAMDAQAIVSKRASRLRAILVARHGEVLLASPKWDADPNNGEMKTAIKKCDALTETITNLNEAMMVLPVTSLAGLHCKMVVGAEVLSFAENGDYHHDELALAFMRDAVRMLEASVLLGMPSLDPGERDAELILACADFNALEAERRGIYDGPAAIVDDDQANAAAAPIQAKMSAVLDRMGTLRASGACGILARARSLALYNGDFKFSLDHPETNAGRLVNYLMRDALEVAA